MKRSKENAARFKVDDQVRVRDMPYMFYTRTQMFTRGVVGTIASLTYKDLIPEEEAFNVDGEIEQFYIVRFRQKDLWPEYPFDNDTLQTECPDRWLEPATK
jgi:Nitrile hydratase beta subunit.